MTEVKNNIRLADYFFRAGLSPHCDLAKIKCSKKVTLTDVESSRRSLTKPGDPHPLENSYEPDTIFRYPKEDYDEHEKYPPFTPIFCFPNDIGFIAQENGKPIDTFHSFIVTESSGRKLYGVCITTHVPPTKNQSAQLEDMISKWRANNLVESDYEFAQHVQQQLAFEKEKLLKINSGMEDSGGESVALVEEKIGVLEELIKPMKKSILVDTDNVFVPTCLGILSRFPFYDLLKDWLSHLMGSIIEAEFERYPFERCVINLIHEIPLPPPGKLEIGISIHNHILYGSRPPINTIPILKNYSSYPLFKAMSIENIVTLFELLVTDYKVILLSEHVSMLNLTCEVVTGWLYPLFWHHILIPVLPFRLLNYLEAPVPYLIGIQKKAFPEWKQDGWRPTDVL
ncbi:AEX-3 domain-containing protein [Globomyces pollinis-pini]|nr:AEX-3 domain-containing protein [Globomyces pollinis-pini]